MFSIQPKNPKDKIDSVKNIYKETQADTLTQQAITDYTQNAFAVLDSLKIDTDKKEILKEFGANLMQREV